MAARREGERRWEKGNSGNLHRREHEIRAGRKDVGSCNIYQDYYKQREEEEVEIKRR